MSGEFLVSFNFPRSHVPMCMRVATGANMSRSRYSAFVTVMIKFGAERQPHLDFFAEPTSHMVEEDLSNITGIGTFRDAGTPCI